MKSSFFDRTLAYIMDTIIVSLLLTIICASISSNINNNLNNANELNKKLLNQEITQEEYIEENKNILYDKSKNNLLYLGITVSLNIAYFAVFQYLNNGQTLGKKAVNIRVVDNNNEKPVGIIRGLCRSLFICNILSGLLNLLLLFILNKNNYFYTNQVVAIVETIFIFTSIFFVLYRKDGRGLHDIMSNTKVIKESR